MNIEPAITEYQENLLVPKDKHEALVRAWQSARKNLGGKFQGAKFLIQGSHQYRTANRPCYPPEQQADLDGGMYLSDFLLKEYGLTDQNVRSKVANVLEQHAVENGWKSVQVKKSCVRIVLGHDMHVDVPVYRVEDSHFKKFFEVSDVAANAEDRFYRRFEMIPDCDVQLACDGAWKNSDPRKIIEWVLERKKIHGARYIRLCRIIKGWRDCQWPGKSPLSSLMLMVMVSDALVQSRAKTLEGDDKALFAVVSNLGDILMKGVKDPDDSVLDLLSDNLNKEEKAFCVRKFKELEDALSDVMHHDKNPDECVKILCRQFGKFFPKAPGTIHKGPAVAVMTTPTVADSPRPHAAMSSGVYRESYFRRIFLSIRFPRMCAFIWGVSKFLFRSCETEADEE